MLVVHRPRDVYDAMVLAWETDRPWEASSCAVALSRWLRTHRKPRWVTDKHLMNLATIGSRALKKLGRDPKELFE